MPPSMPYAVQKDAIGQDSTAARDAVRYFNMAVQLLEYWIAGTLTVSAGNSA